MQITIEYQIGEEAHTANLRYVSEVGVWTLNHPKDGKLLATGSYEVSTKTVVTQFIVEKLKPIHTEIDEKIAKDINTSLGDMFIGGHIIRVNLADYLFKTILTTQKESKRWILYNAETGSMLMEGYFNPEEQTISIVVARSVVHLFQHKLLEHVKKGLFEPSRIEQLDNLYNRYLNTIRSGEFESDLAEEINKHLWHMSDIPCATHNLYGELRAFSNGSDMDFKQFLGKLKSGMTPVEVFNEFNMHLEVGKGATSNLIYKG